MDYAKESLRLHYEWQGKIEVVARAKVDNKDALVREIDDLVSNLMQFKYNIVNEDSQALKDLMNKANKIKEDIG